ncbi:OmpA family protein [Algibacter lectus]|uniref:Outer membrane protein n=1 Tax=Algibacter lectus TaxID=221126 RepID=A0A090VFG4_9FLAO|nr:OmpA family protein [Algibacter lectus]GAL63485.1 outer membrane protein [Algibacter lectus]
MISCNNDKKTKNNQHKEVITEKTHVSNKDNQVKNTSNNSVKEFSWNDVPKSTADIGTYPYITAPKSMIIDKDESESYEFDKLEFFDGSHFFVLEGKVERMIIEMDGDKPWQQYLFDKSVSEYLKSIGAKLIFDGQIPNELTRKWGSDPNSIYKHMHEFYASDVVNHPVSLYALKTSNKKIGFQVSSNSRSIAVVENKIFEQTIEKITAEAIINDINSKGFTSLHINFDTGKSRIKADSYERINEISKMLKENPNLKISIEGHTDNVGDELFNMKLSENRAKAILLSLVDEGIEESRLKSKGFGQTKPIGDNSSEEGKAQNRRVELRKI